MLEHFPRGGSAGLLWLAGRWSGRRGLDILGLPCFLGASPRDQAEFEIPG